MREEFDIRVLEPALIDPAVTAIGGLELLKRYGQTPKRLKTGLAEALEHPAAEVLAAWTRRRPPQCAGLAWYAPAGTFLLGGYLKLLAVAEPFQRKGVGRALLGEVERRVAARSDRLFLLVSDFNHAAARFYEALGYVRAGRLEKLVLRDVDEYIYWKRLDR